MLNLYLAYKVLICLFHKSLSRAFGVYNYMLFIMFSFCYFTCSLRQHIQHLRSYSTYYCRTKDKVTRPTSLKDKL